jgi:hypothetical protein
MKNLKISKWHIYRKINFRKIKFAWYLHPNYIKDKNINFLKVKFKQKNNFEIFKCRKSYCP